MLSLRIFWLELQKNLLPYLKSAPLNLSNRKIFWNNENAYIYHKKCLIWVFLCSIFKKLLSYFKSAPSYYRDSKILWRNKNAYIWNQKCLIWVFLTKRLSMGILGLEFYKILSSYLKSEPLNLSNCKILWNNENAYIWDQKCLTLVFSG